MPHPRKTLRAETVSRLRNIAGLADSVFPGRLLPLKASAMPAICVYTLHSDAQSQGAQTQPSFLDTCTLAIEVYVKAAGADCEDDMDDLIDQIEAAVLCDPTWRTACKLRRVDGITTSYKVDGKGDDIYIGAQLSLSVQFNTTFPPALDQTFAGVDLAVKPVEPRDPNLPFPPEDWQLSPFAKITVDP
ncbi:hypothetical protein [Ferrovibrio xuzhouensis]|uniref:Uncharacterized protein n=1 Tax=Ferrovibrio xuzhouensis TaxID=1576914 RepID=A0ABV7VCJ3_9PROT